MWEARRKSLVKIDFYKTKCRDPSPPKLQDELTPKYFFGKWALAFNLAGELLLNELFRRQLRTVWCNCETIIPMPCGDNHRKSSKNHKSKDSRPIRAQNSLALELGESSGSDSGSWARAETILQPPFRLILIEFWRTFYRIPLSQDPDETSFTPFETSYNWSWLPFFPCQDKLLIDWRQSFWSWN